jgi:hypothetical protein
MAGHGNPAWQKGVSGNPNGRPKRVDVAAAIIREMLEAKSNEKMKQVAHTLYLNATEDRNHKAAQVLMERGYGKTVTQIEVIAPEMTVADLVTGIMNNGRNDDAPPADERAVDAEQS